MNKRKLQWFMEEDDGGGGGGGGIPKAVGLFPPIGTEPKVDTDPDPTPTGGPDPDPDPAPAPAPTNLTTKEFAAELGAVLGQHLKPVPGEKAAERAAAPTPEQLAEARKALKFWEPDDAFLTEFGDLATQKAAFGKMRDGMTNMMVAIVRAMQQEQEQQWDARFTPVQSIIEERTQAEREQRFDTTYPQLAPKELRPFVITTGQQLKAAGALEGLTEAQVYEKIAKEMEKAIRVTNPAFVLIPSGGKPSAKAKPAAATHGLASNSAGGGGGGGSGGGSAAAPGVPKAVSLMPKVRTPA